MPLVLPTQVGQFCMPIHTHDGKFKNTDQTHANSQSFFTNPVETAEEEELRRDAWKWENCLHRSR